MPEDDYLYLYLALKEMSSHQQLSSQLDENWHCIQYRKRQDLKKTWAKLCRIALK